MSEVHEEKTHQTSGMSTDLPQPSRACRPTVLSLSPKGKAATENGKNRNWWKELKKEREYERWIIKRKQRIPEINISSLLLKKGCLPNIILTWQKLHSHSKANVIWRKLQRFVLNASWVFSGRSDLSARSAWLPVDSQFIGVTLAAPWKKTQWYHYLFLADVTRRSWLSALLLN